MEPLTILTFTGGVLGQIALVILRFRPAYTFVERLTDCLQHPRPPPPQAVSAHAIVEAIEELASGRD